MFEGEEDVTLPPAVEGADVQPAEVVEVKSIPAPIIPDAKARNDIAVLVETYGYEAVRVTLEEHRG